MNRFILSFVLASALALPANQPIRAEKADPQSETENENQKLVVTSIDTDQKDQVYDLDEDKALVIGNENQAITLENCTFHLSGTSALETNAKSKEALTAYKLKVIGTVTFKNCTFSTTGFQAVAANTDSNLFLEGESITFDQCAFKSDGYEGQYIGAYMGDIRFIDSTIEAKGNKDGSILYLSEAKVSLENTTIQIEECTSNQALIYANSQDQGALNIEKKSTITIQNNKADAIELNETPMIVDDSLIVLEKNQAGMIGGKVTLQNNASLTSNENENIGLQVDSTLAIDDSSIEVQDNQGDIDTYEDVNTLNNGTITLTNPQEVVLGSLLNEKEGTIEADSHPYEATELSPKEVKTYTITIRYINAQNGEDLGQMVYSDQKEGASYDATNWIQANMPANFKLVSTQGNISGTVDQDLEIIASIQPINEYFVRVNYYDATTNQSIHYSNQLTNLVEGSSWGVERFDQIPIEGYTYVKTEGEIKGENIQHDQIIDVYYQKNEPEPVEESKDEGGTPQESQESSQDEQRVSGSVDTSAQSHQNLYMILGVAALALLIVLVVIGFNKKQKKK